MKHRKHYDYVSPKLIRRTLDQRGLSHERGAHAIHTTRQSLERWLAGEPQSRNSRKKLWRWIGRKP